MGKVKINYPVQEESLPYVMGTYIARNSNSIIKLSGVDFTPSFIFVVGYSTGPYSGRAVGVLTANGWVAFCLKGSTDATPTAFGSSTNMITPGGIQNTSSEIWNSIGADGYTYIFIAFR